MKKSKTTKKLQIERQTVRTLNVTDLLHIEGGSGAHQGQLTWNVVTIGTGPSLTLPR